MLEPKNDVAKYLRTFAKDLAKKAANGAPDRLTVADGQGGITTHAGTIPKDPGEADLKQDLPTDGTGRTSAALGGAPDRLTVADGQGGITAAGGTIPKDPGEAELKQDLPADGTVRKSAGARVAAISAALGAANPRFLPAATVTTPAPVQLKSAGTAGDPPINLSQDTLAKIASAALSTEEGINFIHGIFEKQAGAAAAREQIIEAIHAADAYDNNEQVKQAAYDDVFTKAAHFHEQLSQILTEDDADFILKQAAVHHDALMSLEHPLLKQAYAAGMDDAAVMEGAEEAQGEEGAPPTDEALPMGGEQLSEEEIMQLLQEMIASGEITEEDVMAALEATEGGAGGAEGGDPLADAGGAPPADAGAPPPEAPPADPLAE